MRNFGEIIEKNSRPFNHTFDRIILETPDITYKAYCMDNDGVTFGIINNIYFEAASFDPSGNRPSNDVIGHHTIINILKDLISIHIDFTDNRTEYLGSIKKFTSFLTNKLYNKTIRCYNVNFGNVYHLVEQYKQKYWFKYQVSGRYWWESKIISFWESTNEIPAECIDILIKGVTDCSEYHVRLDELQVDTFESGTDANINNLITWNDFIKKMENGYSYPDINQEERRKLLKLQHLNPQAKKMLVPKITHDIDNNGGFNTTAEYNFRKTIGDSYSPFQKLCDELLVE